MAARRARTLSVRSVPAPRPVVSTDQPRRGPTFDTEYRKRVLNDGAEVDISTLYQPWEKERMETPLAGTPGIYHCMCRGLGQGDARRVISRFPERTRHERFSALVCCELNTGPLEVGVVEKGDLNWNICDALDSDLGSITISPHRRSASSGLSYVVPGNVVESAPKTPTSFLLHFHVHVPTFILSLSRNTCPDQSQPAKQGILARGYIATTMQATRKTKKAVGSIWVLRPHGSSLGGFPPEITTSDRKPRGDPPALAKVGKQPYSLYALHGGTWALSVTELRACILQVKTEFLANKSSTVLGIKSRVSSA
ncbi:hypothetical protein SODALDRAFT_363842 [Sodiomyces alkalinus F11]|uniref:Uncharacterized protein n=1 Tax=Sodiomyces alkalinus (strain CBS 110278 / VKM F-3762 / F11) TaxID=1314773 RepID=A0A3N2PKV8_SODAK|nr:hypothetical protein SODALDRAFT_363842 [Sodiomyces alkalinus F11]ROT35158.1 hypothetical protein SODALDRAFT_363842 [Sodiomyces alkalinus F11]